MFIPLSRVLWSSAQKIAAAAPMVQALYPFGTDSANLLLLKVDPANLPSVVENVQNILGKKGVVSSELSFKDTLEDVFFLSEKVGTLIALVVGAFAFIFVLRATATAVNERRREIALLQAIGWAWKPVRWQLIVENSVLTITGGFIGITAAFAVISGVGEINVTLELPWDISSTPHFLPKTDIDRTQTVSVPLELSVFIMGWVWLGSLVTGALSAFVILLKEPLHPWQLLRSE